MRTRWICIGQVRRNTILVSHGMQGRRGYWINWRGRTDWCQPNEFYDFDGVAWATRIHLKRYGLDPITFASRPPSQEYQPLWVEVRRLR